MVSKKVKQSIVEELKKIRGGLNEINSVQQTAIEYELINLINLLKKHILDKQNKLDKYIDKLEELTNDSVAKGLLETITYELSSTGNEYATILKFESENKKPTSEVENLDVMLTICHKLFQLILRLEKIEEFLDFKV